jgi:hypothetical protein
MELPEPGDIGVAKAAFIPQQGSSQVSEQQGMYTSNLASKGPGKKPRERWTAEEHERFLEGLKMFHRDWKSIESVLLTATSCRASLVIC